MIAAMSSCFFAEGGDCMKKKAFTLIELLIVVLIIAILAAIAVPNFLEAQVRAKVARVKADMRSVAMAVETYYADNDAYMPGYGTTPQFVPYGLWALSTPIAYISQGKIKDPFFTNTESMTVGFLLWDLIRPDHSIIDDSSPPTSGDDKGVYWLMESRGPDHTSGFSSSDPEFDIRVRWKLAETDLGQFVDTIYDPTNGSVSTGNVMRVGGSGFGRAAQFVNSHM
jgi:prepilin-type N-terminal cleavage/methylation domain-containing protein